MYVCMYVASNLVNSNKQTKNLIGNDKGRRSTGNDLERERERVKKAWVFATLTAYLLP